MFRNNYIEDNASITAPEIKAKCRSLARGEKGLALVVIDYLIIISSLSCKPLVALSKS